MPVESVAPNTLQAFFEKQVRETPDGTALYSETNNTPMLRLRPKRIRLHVIYAAMESAAPITGSACWEKENGNHYFYYRCIKNGCCLCSCGCKVPKERRDFILENSGSRLLLSEELYRSGIRAI